MVPATIMQSDCLGENRITSIPNLEISYREAAEAISSIAQHASPIGIGQTECFLIQLITALRHDNIAFYLAVVGYFVCCH